MLSMPRPCQRPNGGFRAEFRHCARPRIPAPLVLIAWSYPSVYFLASPLGVAGGLLLGWLCGKVQGCSRLYRDPEAAEDG